MTFIVVGINHNHSPLSIRERLSFSRRKTEEALSLASTRPGIAGAVILSTCNRVEIYGEVNDAARGLEILEDFLFTARSADPSVFLPYLYRYGNKDAVRHLFAVTAGLDSQIPGERQIGEQVRSAFIQADGASALTEKMRILFLRALEVGKRVRRETGVSEGNVSFGSLTRRLVREVLGELNERTVVIIGTGKMALLVGTYLAQEGARIVLVSNRNYPKAARMAREVGGRAGGFSELGRFIRQADAVISATASPHLIVGIEDLTGAKKPLLIVDLAVPRDVDPAVGGLPGVTLFNLDGLSRIMKENLGRRRREARRAEEIIERETELIWRELLQSEPVVAAWH